MNLIQPPVRQQVRLSVKLFCICHITHSPTFARNNHVLSQLGGMSHHKSFITVLWFWLPMNIWECDGNLRCKLSLYLEDLAFGLSTYFWSYMLAWYWSFHSRATWGPGCLSITRISTSRDWPSKVLCDKISFFTASQTWCRLLPASRPWWWFDRRVTSLSLHKKNVIWSLADQSSLTK